MDEHQRLGRDQSIEFWQLLLIRWLRVLIINEPIFVNPSVRLIPPIWMLFAIIDVYLIDKFIPSITVYTSPWTNTGYALITIGFSIVLWCALQFLKHKTTIHPGHTPTSLITTGIYRFSRNPIYLAMAIIIAGFALTTANLVTFPMPLIFIAIITVLFIEPEEHILHEQFGDQYTAYTNSTRRWI